MNVWQSFIFCERNNNDILTMTSVLGDLFSVPYKSICVSSVDTIQWILGDLCGFSYVADLLYIFFIYVSICPLASYIQHWVIKLSGKCKGFNLKWDLISLISLHSFFFFWCNVSSMSHVRGGWIYIIYVI